MNSLAEFEAEVMNRLLAGDHPYLALLRDQYRSAVVRGHELSGKGFVCTFDVPASQATLPDGLDCAFGDVVGTLQGVINGVGFLLFVRDGLLSMLEGFTYGEPWPSEIGEFTLDYLRKPRRLNFRMSSEEGPFWEV